MYDFRDERLSLKTALRVLIGDLFVCAFGIRPNRFSSKSNFEPLRLDGQVRDWNIKSPIDQTQC